MKLNDVYKYHETMWMELKLWVTEFSKTIYTLLPIKLWEKVKKNYLDLLCKILFNNLYKDKWMDPTET